MRAEANSFAGLHGLPKRMAAAVYATLTHGGPRLREREVLAKLLRQSSRIPLDAGKGAIYAAADKAARECHRIISSKSHPDFICLQIESVCKQMGVCYPLGADHAGQWARASDSQWWVRALRKEFARRFENTAIQLGQVGKRIDPYITRESAWRQAERNRDNAKRLAETEIVCQDGPQAGQTITLAQAAAAGMANKANRRGELMTRIRGFQEIADSMKHKALFATITAPSKYHAVGGRNAKYADFTPREAQAYLCGVWARIRAAFKRQGIVCYGFRVAEPHEDGCPHWHLLLFVPRNQLAAMKRTIKDYALQEDGNEAGAKKQRVKLVTMDAGKGTAAGYIAKYISKNIDGLTESGDSMGAHRAYQENADGTVNLRAWDQVGAANGLTPAERVCYWSQLHGIRQFQQIGGAPVGVWRELRRVDEKEIDGAPQCVVDAWHAVQRKGEVLADWKAYVMAQGGPSCGRDAAIGIWRKEVTIAGRYGLVEASKPCGVWAVKADGVFQAQSARYEWKPVEAGAVDLPWTGVNNCTRDADTAALMALGGRFSVPEKSEWTGRELLRHDGAVDWAGIEAKSKELDKATAHFAAGPRRKIYKPDGARHV